MMRIKSRINNSVLLIIILLVLIIFCLRIALSI